MPAAESVEFPDSRGAGLIELIGSRSCVIQFPLKKQHLMNGGASAFARLRIVACAFFVFTLDLLSVDAQCAAGYVVKFNWQPSAGSCKCIGTDLCALGSHGHTLPFSIQNGRHRCEWMFAMPAWILLRQQLVQRVGRCFGQECVIVFFRHSFFLIIIFKNRIRLFFASQLLLPGVRSSIASFCFTNQSCLYFFLS